MKIRLLLLAAFTVMFASATGHAQFYSPDTEYHDRTQRHFAVELARVLAWRQNHQSSNSAKTSPLVAEVTYEVSTSPKEDTMWKIHWLDAHGASLRDFNVSYDGALPAKGMEFYHAIASQMGVSFPKPAKGTSKLIALYWQGADMAGPSRAESLRATFKLDAKDPSNAPKLAGLLTDAALPALGNGLSLDSLLLARAAAWLCIAESAAGPAEQNSAALWAPILFLSGRENDAFALCNDPSVRAQTPAASPAAKWWAEMLSHPTSREAFLYCADPANRSMAFPMLEYESRCQTLGPEMAATVQLLFPDNDSVAPWHDYAPLLELYSEIGGGRILDGAWAAFSRRSWIECIRSFTPEPWDFQGYKNTLDNAVSIPPLLLRLNPRFY